MSKKTETPRADAAKEARFRYTSQWSDEDKAKMMTASQEEQMEWVKNCPPDGWEIARQLERELAQWREVAGRLREALEKIRNYPVHSEPVGGAMAMQDIAYDALAKLSEKP